MDLVYILQIFGRAARIFQSPVVIPVENDADLGRIFGAEGLVAKAFELFAELCGFAEHAGVLIADMRDHGTVEFLASANASAELEELDGVCAVRDGLVTLGAHLSRTF